MRISKESALALECLMESKVEEIFNNVIQDIEDMDITNSEMNKKLYESTERLQNYKTELVREMNRYTFE